MERERPAPFSVSSLSLTLTHTSHVGYIMFGGSAFKAPVCASAESLLSVCFSFYFNSLSLSLSLQGARVYSGVGKGGLAIYLSCL